MQYPSLPVIVLAIAMIASAGCMGSPVKPVDQATPVTTLTSGMTTATMEPVPTTIAMTATPEPDPYPKALRLKEMFKYNSGKTASEGTVYRYWLNDTYQMYLPRETSYITKHPVPGNKFLFLFVSTVNLGTARTLPLDPGNIMVHYDSMTFYPDPTHMVPKADKNVDAPPEIIRVGEIEFLHKFYGSEYVEDFGYSHGIEQAYLTPGESNAIDGYIIFQVPASLIPEKTYVEIPFTSQDSVVWKLA